MLAANNYNTALTLKNWEQIGYALNRTIPRDRVVNFNISFHNDGQDFYDTYELSFDSKQRRLIVQKDGEFLPWEDVFRALKNITNVDFKDYQQTTFQEYVRANMSRTYSENDISSMFSLLQDQMTGFSHQHMMAIQDVLKQQLSLAEMRSNLALTQQRYKYERVIERQQVKNDVERREQELAHEAQQMRDHFSRKEEALTRKEERIRALAADYETKRAGIARERQALDESWAKFKRDTETAKKSQQQQAENSPKGKTKNEERALELEKQLVAEQSRYNERKEALLEKERSELEQAKIDLEVGKLTLKAEKEKLDQEKKDLDENFRTPQSTSKRAVPTIPQRHTPLRSTNAVKKKIQFVDVDKDADSGNDDDDNNSSGGDEDSDADPSDPFLAVKREADACDASFRYGKHAKTRTSAESDSDEDEESRSPVPADIKFHTVAGWIRYINLWNVDVFLLRVHNAYVTGAATSDDLTERLWKQFAWWTVGMAEQKCSSESLLLLGQDLLNQVRLRVAKVKQPTLDTRGVQQFVDVENDPDDKLLKAFNKVPSIQKRRDRFKGDSRKPPSRRSRSRSPRSRSQSPKASGNSAALYCQNCSRYGHSTAKCYKKNGAGASSK